MTRDASGPTFREVLALLAPGSLLREGIDRIIRGGRGTLIVIGWPAELEAVASGGVAIDTRATSQRIAELAKMDGAVIVDREATRILRANVHLVPDPTIETSETGIRHRSAERTARQTGVPVIAVSEALGMVTLYQDDHQHSVEEISVALFRANQALSTLERYRARLDEVAATLSAREVEDAVTVRDVVLTLQRAEMLRRIAREVAGHVVELGSEGRLIQLQLDELMTPVIDERELVTRDYLADRRRNLKRVLHEVESVSTDQLLDIRGVAALLAYDGDELDRTVTPRGYRLLGRLPRLPAATTDRIVDRYGTLTRIMRASVADLASVDGVGEAQARAVADGLRRLSENSFLDRRL